MTLDCPPCGNLSDDAVRFCTSCGNPMVPTDNQTRTTTIQQQYQIPPAAPSDRNKGRWIITIAVVIIVVILTALYSLQVSGVLTLFPPATTTVTQKAFSPQATSSITPANPTPDLTKKSTETPQGSAIITNTLKISPTVTKVPVCPSYQQSCGGICTDTMTDRKNCGNCSVSCSITDICSKGRCMPRCTDSETSCADGCHDLLFDAENCGLCGNSCPKGLSCNNSVCTPPLKTAIPTYAG